MERAKTVLLGLMGERFEARQYRLAGKAVKRSLSVFPMGIVENRK